MPTIGKQRAAKRVKRKLLFKSSPKSSTIPKLTQKRLQAIANNKRKMAELGLGIGKTKRQPRIKKEKRLKKNKNQLHSWVLDVI